VTSAISWSDEGAARVLTLSRAPLNVLDMATLGKLDEALSDLGGRTDLKALVVRSALPGTFSAGMDVADHTRDRVADMLHAVHAVMRTLRELRQVTIALVDGRALGGGAELALACDVVLASPASTFGFPEIDVGCFPPVAAVLLPRLAGRAALELVVTGRTIDAEEARTLGIVSRVVPDVAAAGQELVDRLSGKSAAVLALARRAVNAGGYGTFAAALEQAEQTYLRELLRTDDMQEGVEAFLEKRPPRWTDR
jgi:cyclohexa-1,5-dienecarbonyl-CoA hydratase